MKADYAAYVLEQILVKTGFSNFRIIIDIEGKENQISKLIDELERLGLSSKFLNGTEVEIVEIE